MSDYGARYTDKVIAQTEQELKRTYRQAQKELKKKMRDFEARFAEKNAEKKRLLKAGKITEQQYKDWLTGQVFIRNQWQSKIRDVSAVMHDCNKQAVNLINSRRLDVFAENYNYMAFRGEASTGISFGVYNSQSVALLIADNPQILPKWKIDEEKDYEWNEQKVNNIVRQGIIQGESIPEIADRLVTDLSAMNEHKMEMFARTAMTEAQSAGRQQQMNDAADMGIEVHKQWLATLDNRTRDAHRKLDGQEVPYNEPFDSPLGEIDYPGDPDAEDPANVYNCRCTMVTIYPKYEDRSKPDWREQETVDGMTYQEWKEGKKKKQEQQQVAQAGTEQKTAEEPKSAIDRVKAKIKEHGEAEWTTDELIELGKMVDEALEEEKEEVDIAKLEEECEKWKKADEDKDREIAEVRHLMSIAKHEGRTEDYKKLQEQFNQLDKESDEIFEKRKAARKELRRAKNIKTEALPKVLPKIREASGVTKDNIGQILGDGIKGVKKETKESIAEAMSLYPKKWIEASKSFKKPMRVRSTTGRAHYEPWTGTVYTDGTKDTSVHEMAHRIEAAFPALLKAEKEFYERRTQGEQLAWLGDGYKKTEKTRRDSFISSYMGKDYGGSFYELASMGYAMMFTDYERLSKGDQEMLYWLLGMLAGL